MSLINEALKRAEKDKAARVGQDAQARATGASGAGPKTRRVGLGKVAFLGAALAGTIALMMYRLLPPERKGATPAQAGASPAATAPAKTSPSAGEQATSRAPQRPGRRPAPAATQPAPKPAASAPAKPTTPATLPATQPAGAASQPSQPDAPRATAPPATQPATEPPRKTPPPAEEIHPDSAGLRLGGIMHSGGTASAIINNHLVGIGDIVDGARVVTISRYHVELEKGGRKIILRM